MENRFNLIDEKWIPIQGESPVSLLDIFSQNSPESLGGTAIQKLAMLKLFLAIAQRAKTPKDVHEWNMLRPEGLGKTCTAYLNTHHDQFYLYGEKPFLQIPILAQAKTMKGEPLPIMPIGRNYHPDIPSDNDSVINQIQINRVPTDADKILFILSIMNYAFAGKRTTHMLPLTEGCPTKKLSAASGPTLGNFFGYQNNCLWGTNILETVWLNLFTREDLIKFPQWADDSLIPPWEEMPTGEDDYIARRLKNSFMGTLIAMSRFVLLKEDGILYTDGLQYPSFKQGWREPFLAIKSEDKVQYLSTSKRPWRDLDSLLALSLTTTTNGYVCPQIQVCLQRARNAVPTIGIWSGGLKVRANAGDQSVKQDDDFIESLVWLDTSVLGEPWFITLENEMKWLEYTGYILKKSVKNYFTSLKETKATIYEKAAVCFWEYCETQFPEILDLCSDPESLPSKREEIIQKGEEVYSRFCGKDTARQLTAWVKHHPRFSVSGRRENNGK